jgi:hypothetical protein
MVARAKGFLIIIRSQSDSGELQSMVLRAASRAEAASKLVIWCLPVKRIVFLRGGKLADMLFYQRLSIPSAMVRKHAR